MGVVSRGVSSGLSKSYPHPVDKYLKLAVDNGFYIYMLRGYSKDTKAH